MENVNIEQLIQKSLVEQLHPDEEVILSEWRAANEQNEAEYRAYQKIWDAANEYEIPKWDVKTALKDINERVTLKKKTFKPVRARRSFPSWNRIAIAASFLLIFSLASYLFYEKVRDGSSNTAFADIEDIELILSDGSEVHLKKGSTLSYPGSFNHKFRYVKLTGEAFFQIEKNVEKPFVVETNRAKVTVLGTAFGIDATEENMQKTDLYVTEGAVKFQSKLNDEVTLQVSAGEQASLQKNALIPVRKSSFNDIAWHTKTLVFKNVEMHQVVKDLSAYYNVKINLDEAQIGHCPITAPLPFQNAPLEEVFEILKTLLSVEVQQSGTNQYALVGGKCK